MVKVWFDALTAKQARIAAILSLEGKRRGIDVLVTCRNYDYVVNVLKLYGVNGVCFGEHGEDLTSKLVSSLSRSLKMIEVLGNFDVHVSLTSPEAFRVAFGLGKPSIALTDTAHAYHVNKLTLPLANEVIAPVAIPKRRILAYIPYGEGNKVKMFDGLFEVMWVYRFRPSWDEVNSLGIKQGDEYVVFRFEESKAAYYTYGEQGNEAIKTIDLLLKEGFKVVAFPRYEGQKQLLEKHFNEEIKGGLVIIPTRPIDGLNLAYYSSLVISGGSTFAVEASILGIPSISYFPTKYYTDTYIVRKGAPLIRVKPSQLTSAIRRALKMGKTGLIKDLEDPTYIILEDSERMTNIH